MKKKLIFSLLVLAGVPSLSMAVDEARLLRFPATNGNEIVFSYAGDLYKVPATGGEARRLTSHVGYEMFPRFSPDGKTIAFTGQYDGNTEVYTMPVTGGRLMAVGLCIATASAMALAESCSRWKRRVACLKPYLFLKVDSAAILPMVNSWLITVSCGSSVPGNTTKAGWRMMSGSIVPIRRQSKTLRTILHRTLSRCGSAMKSSFFPTVTEQ